MIVVVGLGNIGLAIAQRLAEAQGDEVVGVDPSEERRALWATDGTRRAEAGLDAVGWSDRCHVVIVVRLTDQAFAVLEELADRVPSSTEMTVWIVTTLDPDAAAELRGIDHVGRIIELPVSGGHVGARRGELTAMTAGPLTDDDRVFVSALSTSLVEFERYGEPTLAKLVNNVLGAYNASAFATMLTLADRLGVDPTRMREVILTSSGGSWMAGGFMDLIDDLLTKDAGLLETRAGTLPTIEVHPEGSSFTDTLEVARSLLDPDRHR